MEFVGLPMEFNRQYRVREQTVNPENTGEHEEEIVCRAIYSLQELSALETQTLATEINLLGLLRDRISPAALNGDKIQIKYRKLPYKPASEAGQATYLSQGFPFTEQGKPLLALLVIDGFDIVQVEPSQGNDGGSGQYVGERLHLTHDRKWILAERFGAYGDKNGAANEWEATCRIVTDRTLLEHYSLEAISEGLFAATNKLWDRLTPRMEALRKRSEKASQVSGALSQMKNLRIELSKETPEQEPQPKKEKTKVNVIWR